MNIIASSTADPSLFTVTFLASFWSQLLATFIIVVIGSLIIPRIVRWNQRAKLRFGREGFGKENKFQLNQAPNGEWDITLSLVVRNEGTKTIERFYWEMYFDKSVSFHIDQKPPFPRYYTSDERIEGDFRHRYGYIEMPIFPYDRIPFVHELRFRVTEKKKFHIYYYFRTDLGESPFWGWYALSRKKYSWLKSLVIS